MPRIPDSEIERIKSETNLVALIQSRGVTLKQQGQNWTGLCPFHDDKQTPNLIVTPGKGLFRCMAANCGKTGNAIQFVQWHDGISFRHAFELLANGGKAAFEQSGGTAKKASPQNSLAQSMRKATRKHSPRYPTTTQNDCRKTPTRSPTSPHAASMMKASSNVLRSDFPTAHSACESHTPDARTGRSCAKTSKPSACIARTAASI